MEVVGNSIRTLFHAGTGKVRSLSCKQEGARMYVLLTVAMLVAALPGWLLTPFSINVFDEPYQILNALDWQNAVYSPLSSWLAHWFGVAFDWKFLAFRRLTFSFCFIGIYACSVYALRLSPFKLRIIAFSAFSTFMFLCPISMFFYYGWDSWTVLGVCLATVTVLSMFQGFKGWKVVLLGLIAGLTAMMRITNVTIIFFVPVIVWLAGRRGEVSKAQCLTATAGCFVLAAAVACAVLCGLFGSIGAFAERFASNSIGDHSVYEIVAPLFTKFFVALAFTALYFAGYRVMKYSSERGRGWFIASFILLVLIFTASLCLGGEIITALGSTGSLGAVILLYLYLLMDRESRRKWGPVVVAIFLLSLVTAIGSNGGFKKALSWPLVPILIAFMGDRFTPMIRRFSAAVLSGFTLFIVISLSQSTFLDEGIGSLSYRFGTEDGVLEGMRTNEERGRWFSTVNRELKPYREASYRFIPLKQGNDYIWEYMTLTRNPYQRHNFSNWEAFWDEEYVDAIRREAREAVSSGGKVLVMYMQWKDDENPSPMYEMLQREMRCVLDKPGYSFWVKAPALTPALPAGRGEAWAKGPCPAGKPADKSQQDSNHSYRRPHPGPPPQGEGADSTPDPYPLEGGVSGGGGGLRFLRGGCGGTCRRAARR